MCYDHCISITFAGDSPPPLYLCIECANEIHREHPNQIFCDILHPMQQVSMICENKVRMILFIAENTHFLNTCHFRIVDLQINQLYLYAFQRNVQAIMEIIRFDIVNNARIIVIIIEEAETILYIGVYHPRGLWMPKCKPTWWRPL